MVMVTRKSQNLGKISKKRRVLPKCAPINKLHLVLEVPGSSDSQRRVLVCTSRKVPGSNPGRGIYTWSLKHVFGNNVVRFSVMYRNRKILDTKRIEDCDYKQTSVTGEPIE